MRLSELKWFSSSLNQLNFSITMPATNALLRAHIHPGRLATMVSVKQCAVPVALLLAAFVLPSSLNVPQSNPSTTLEFAPVPPEDEFAFAGLDLGGVLVAIQPARGFGENPVAVYHSPDLAPTHHYLAFYRWLEEAWGADAVVHVGKHGTLDELKVVNDYPVPQTIEGHVVIRVRASSFNYHDVFTVKGLKEGSGS